MKDSFEQAITSNSFKAPDPAPGSFVSKTEVKQPIDNQPPVLSSTDQSFTTTAGTALTLVNVTATDAKDGAITVIQSGDAVDFNQA